MHITDAHRKNVLKVSSIHGNLKKKKKMQLTIWEIGNRLTKIKKLCQYQVLLGMWINGNTNTLHVRGKIFTTLLEDRLY